MTLHLKKVDLPPKEKREEIYSWLIAVAITFGIIFGLPAALYWSTH